LNKRLDPTQGKLEQRRSSRYMLSRQYRVIRNSLTRFIKTAHMNDGKDCCIAPLAATDETKRPRHVKINLESFSFYTWVARGSAFRHSSVPILWYASGNHE